MRNGRIVIARLILNYNGTVPSRAGVIMGLNPERFETILIYLTRCSKEENFFEKKGYKAYYLYGNKLLNTFRPLILTRLVKILKDEKVDIVHCHRHKPTVYGVIAVIAAGTPAVISHVHGISRTKNLRRRITNFFIFRKVNRILTVGEAAREDVLKANPSVPAGKVVSIGNSIDYERYANVSLSKEKAKERLGVPPDSYVFGTVARMAPNKGQIYLIKAFAKAKKVLPTARLIFVGDGRLRSKLEKQARCLVPDGSVHFLGRRKDVPDVLRTMNAFVLPSVGSEGLPRSLLEAMAAGIPCISTEVGGIPEIIGNDEFGLVVPPKDENALAEAMIESANKRDEELKEFLEKAQQRVKNLYNHGDIVKQLEQLYETCMVSN